MKKILYGEISAAVVEQCQNSLYKMDLRNFQEVCAVREAVNIGIDSHLEACFMPDRGDKYYQEDNALACRVSAESLPVLIRRLSESDNDEGESLASDILVSLGFDVETCCFEITRA